MNLQQIIDDIVVKENEERNKDRKDKASPSNIGKCLRALMMMERGEGERIPFTAQQLRVFRAGYLFEKFVTDCLKKSDRLVECQLPVEYRGMKGTLDYIVTDDDGSQIIVDCKSVHSRKFNYLDIGEVDTGYALQQTCYYLGAKASGKFPKLSTKALLFYVEKECLLTKTIEINVDEWKPRLDKIIDDIELARKREDIPPELDPMAKGEWRCFTVQKSRHKVPRFIGLKRWCPFLMSCPGVCATAEKIEKQIKEAENDSES